MTRTIPVTVESDIDGGMAITATATFTWQPPEHFDGYGTKPGYWRMTSIEGDGRELTAGERERAEDGAMETLLYT